MSLDALFSLSGQVAIVTGAGRGIGRGIAEHFAQAGATVICAARTLEDLEKTVASCKAAGGNALAQVCDVAQEEQLQALVNTAVNEFGRLDILVNNAGGAWDNAKKYVEDGHFGGKGGETHKGCVVGDTVGDPLKDTSGPSMNIMINVMAIVSIVIAPLLA